MKGFPKFLIGAAALSVAGACAAQAASSNLHTMLVNLPDGSVAHVQYSGDVAPRIVLQPVDMVEAPTPMPDVFASMAQVSAMMDRQAAAMMQQAALMQHEALAPAGINPQGITAASMANLPQGMHMTYVSSTTDASGCTRTVSYSSDGTANTAPKVTQAASDGCNAVKPNTQTTPAKAEAQVPVSQPDSTNRRV